MLKHSKLQERQENCTKSIILLYNYTTPANVAVGYPGFIYCLKNLKD